MGSDLLSMAFVIIKGRNFSGNWDGPELLEDSVITPGTPYVRTYEGPSKSEPALDAEYGLLGCSGDSSFAKAPGCMSPYTSSVEICTNFFTWSLRATFSRMAVPVTLVSITGPGS